MTDDNNNDGRSKNEKSADEKGGEGSLKPSSYMHLVEAIEHDIEHVKEVIEHDLQHVKEVIQHDLEAAKKSLRVLIPRPEPIKWYIFIFLFVIVSIPAAIYIVLFTDIGYGTMMFNLLSTYDEKYDLSMWMAVGIGLVTYSFYLIDVQHWKTHYGRLMQVCLVLGLSCALCIFVLVVAGRYPFGPILLFSALTTVWLVFVHNIVFATTDTRTFITWLGGPLIFSFLATLIWWIVWINLTEYNEWTRIIKAGETGCKPDFTKFPECENITSTFTANLCFDIEKDDNEDLGPIYLGDNTLCELKKCTKTVYSKCSNAYMLHDGPLFVSLINLFFGFTTTFLRTNHSHETEIYAFVKFWGVLLVIVWVAASLSGANGSIATVFGVLTIGGFIGSGLMLLAVTRTDEMRTKIDETWHILEANYGGYFDVARGLLVLMCSPLLLFIVYTSMLKQCFRKMNLPCETRPTTDAWVTEETAYYLDGFYSWNRVKVYTYGIYIGMGVNILTIFMRFTNLFLAWVIEVLKESGMNIHEVTGILIGLCTLLLMLPPIPGAPIYLLFGIVVIPIAVNQGGWSILAAVIYGSLSALLLKFISCALQQKAIGGQFSKSIAVRQGVSINSPLTRAMKLILTEPGFTLGKTAILIGAPDWPTSVFCGILKMSLFQALVGTLPLYPIGILPTVFMGSLMYMNAEQIEEGPLTGSLKYEWAGTVLALMTAVVAVNSTCLALGVGYFVEQTLHLRKEEMDAIPIDKEVEELDKESATLAIVYEKVTKWDIVPTWAKIVISFSMFFMTVSTYLTYAVSKATFKPFAITDSIAKDLGGKPLSMVQPLGWVAMLFILLSGILLQVFRKWATNAAILEEEKNPVEVGEEIKTNKTEGIKNDDDKN